jgi:hypothetical protein
LTAETLKFSTVERKKIRGAMEGVALRKVSKIVKVFSPWLEYPSSKQVTDSSWLRY